MNIGPFFFDDPIGLTLASDDYFANSSSPLDVIWQLRFDAHSPLQLYSTLGLQAQSFQVFPQFSFNKIVHTNVDEFFAEARLQVIYSNFARLVLTPFECVNALFDIWIRNGSLVQGRIQLTNHSETNQEIGARIAARLVSLRGNSDFKHIRQGYHTCLKGSSGNLFVSLNMDGISKTVLSPNVGLEQTKVLPPGGNLKILWQAEILHHGEIECKHALSFPTNWDAEVAKIEVANQSRMVQVSTPHAAWDATLFSHQNQSFQLLRESPSGELQIAKTRSIHSIASEFPNAPQLNGEKLIHALDLWQMLLSLIPAQTQLAAELFARHIAKALDECGNGSTYLAQFPCLVRLGWKIHHYFQQKDYLESVFPALFVLTDCWFSKRNDRDQDGMPEWESPEQSRLDSLSLFNITDASSLATRIRSVESFGLAHLLNAELETLESIAAILGKDAETETIRTRKAGISAWLEAQISKIKKASFLDFETHATHKEQQLFEGMLQDFGQKPHYLEQPARLNLRLRPQLMLRKPPPFTIIGENLAGNLVEEIVSPEELVWLPDSFFLTSKQIYRRVDRLDGLSPETMSLQLYTVNLNQFDISWFLGTPQLDIATEVESENTSPALIQWLSTNNLGIPVELTAAPEVQTVNNAWNNILLSWLIENDEREQAFRLYSQLMVAQSSLLKSEHVISENWQVQSGRAQGLKNSVSGLMPICLFLELAGIHIYHENKVRLQGSNPFPWQISIRFRGLEVTRNGKNATIRFPNGQLEHHFGSSQKTFSHSGNPESLA